MNRSPFRGGARAAVRQAHAEAADVTELLLYDEIGYWGITARDFAEQLQGVTTPVVRVRLNSPGGSVFDGFAIYNALKAYPGRVITQVDALAASIASVIALAGDEVRMAENAFLMIHEPWTLTMGTAAQLRKDAETLDKFAASIQQIYMQASEQSAEQVKQWMADETWLSAQEALDSGFIDAVDARSEATADWDLSVFAKVPAALQAAGDGPTKRQVERALREAGLSRAAAKAFVAQGWDAVLAPRDADDETALQEGLQALIDTLTP